MQKGLAAGAIVALALSIFHSQMFRPDVFGWSGRITWHLVSFLVGCGAGFLAGGLIRLVPARLHSSIAYFVGALSGAAGYLIQFYLFLLYTFRHTSWE
jgi:hypothetical protein